MYEATAEAVLIARVPGSFITQREAGLDVELAGIPGDRHYGLLRPADSRQRFYPRGTMVANRRQISIVSVEECARVAAKLGIAELLPEWLGANILLSGYEELTSLPQGARLLFPDGAGLICEGENAPCTDAGQAIAEAEGIPGIKTAFVKTAYRMRGIVCSVEREGMIRQGDPVKIMIEGV
ncbi:MOSC domain-containing protein [Paenibacillus doosanensis]|uniref:MOSC domain-containing protein n=1 Tax=Paenibacillus doosanensis TaxID=1229154 RepID=UPI00217FCBBC|nr:MOSC domain-containing protein [Paenibacillus doosanensis]MCS7464772.1 MOSC domain-containing protein [Paenibacillus doosanensis]